MIEGVLRDKETAAEGRGHGELQRNSFTVVRVCGGLNLSPRVRFSWNAGDV